MANTKSSKKDLRRSAKKRLVNTSVKSALKTHVKKVRVAAKGGEETKEALVAAVSALDKAVQRGIIHKNQAARRKSRIAKLAANVNKPAAAPVAVEEGATEKPAAKKKAATPKPTTAKPKAAAAKKKSEA